MNDLFRHRLLIISGKGGVGKTTLAAALGIVCARAGKTTLVAEVEGKRALSALFDSDPLTPEPLQLRNNLYGMNISPEEALEEYLDVQFKMRTIAKPLASSQLVDYVTHAAPGLRDILMLGKVWHLATRKQEFDVIVLDTPAAGHAVSMLRSPIGFLHAVPVGPLAGHARQVLEWLQDPEEVSIHLASMPEEMPVNETIETTQMLEDKLGMNVASVFLNMLYPEFEAEGALKQINSPEELVRLSTAELSSDGARELWECGRFYSARRALQQEHRKDLQGVLSYTATIIDLPYLFCDRFGVEQLEDLADAIEEGLDP